MAANPKKVKVNKEPNDLLHKIQESEFFHWLEDNAQKVGYGLFALLIGMILAFKFSIGSSASSEVHYAQAENTFAFLLKSIRGEKGAINTATAIERLQEATDVSPELQAKYDGIIAQLLLIQGDEQEASLYTNRLLERIEDNNLPLYTQFTKTTLTIANQKYEQALEEAKKLNTNLQGINADDNFGNTLYVYNTLRVAMLEKKIGTPNDEKIAWENWKNLSQQPKLAAAQKMIQNELEEGSFTLAQYIEHREKILSGN